MTALDKFFASTNYKITQLQITQEIEFIGKILLTGLEIVAIFFFFTISSKIWNRRSHLSTLLNMKMET